MSKKYFVCGDIHSFFSEWMDALSKKGFDRNNEDHIIVICGDLFDRGDETIKCLEFAKEMKREGRLLYIRGNHEDLVRECYYDIRKGSSWQFHARNGTMTTVAAITDTNVFDLMCGIVNWRVFDKKMKEFLDFLDDTTVDYAEIDDYVLTHGWIPVTSDVEKFREGNWAEARWTNGMDAWSKGFVPAGKTIICGHWHTSWGWYHLKHRATEWDDDAIFEPFIDDGIIALDGCVAHTRNVNCIVIESDK